MFFAHSFRIDRDVHVVISARSRIRRGQDHRAVCAQPISIDAVRVTSQAAISCDICVSGLAAISDLIDD